LVYIVIFFKIFISNCVQHVTLLFFNYNHSSWCYCCRHGSSSQIGSVSFFSQINCPLIAIVHCSMLEGRHWWCHYAWNCAML